MSKFTRKEIPIRMAFFIASIALVVGITQTWQMSSAASLLVGAVSGGAGQLLAGVCINR